MRETTDSVDFLDAEDAPHGRIERNGRHIKLYDFKDGGLTAGLRSIHIYLPQDYAESADSYPVVYFNDGGNAFSGHIARMNVDLTYDGLLEEGLIHQALFVGIGIAGLKRRVRDLAPTENSGYQGHWPGIGGVGGGLEGYYRFIAEHLKPFFDRHYRTRPEPAATGIAGYSLGGSSAFLMAYNHPETFGLAGCMSPSFFWDDEYALRLVAEDQNGKRPVRFWLDGEYDAWEKVAHAYRLLEAKGWTPGDDLAAYLDYLPDHRFESAAGRMREMLHFLLRKEPYRLEGYRLVEAAHPTAPKMDLTTGHRRIVGAEAWYAGGWRLTVPRPVLTVADTHVVTMDAEDPTLVHLVGPGETMITSTYQGLPATLAVVGDDPETARHYVACPPGDAAVLTAADWDDLPHGVLGSDQRVVARFGVRYDTQYVHLVILVRNDSPVVEDGRLTWEQDGIGVYFDARPETDLRKGQGYSDPDEFLYVGLSPRPAGEPSCLYPGPDAWARFMPAGTRATCVTTPGGYCATLSLPVRYLDEKQGVVPWEVFRLNLCVSNYDVIGGTCTDARWQPGWLDFSSPIGSGIFRRA